MKRFELVDALNRRTMAVRELMPEADRPDFTKQAVINKHTRMLGEGEAEPFNIYVRQGIINGKGMESVEAAFAMHITAYKDFATAGQFAYAEQLYTIALDARRKVYPAPSFRLGETLVYLANLYIRQGEYERPKKLLEEATELLEASLKRGDSQYPILAQVYIAQQKLFDTHEHHDNHWVLAAKITEVITGKPPTAEVLEGQIEGHRGREYPDAPQVLNDWASIHVSNRRFGHALPIYENMLKLMDEMHPLYVPTLKSLANLYATSGRRHLADPLYERAKVAETNAAANPPVVDTTPKARQDSIDLADDLLKEMEDQ
jgi:tetratricopeptide (TPR) repeat protein